jgi:hypothetical protein
VGDGNTSMQIAIMEVVIGTAGASEELEANLSESLRDQACDPPLFEIPLANPYQSLMDD